MDKVLKDLENNLKKELEQINAQVNEKGFTKEKLEVVGQLVEVWNDTKEGELLLEGGSMNYNGYGYQGYEGYGARGGGGNRGGGNSGNRGGGGGGNYREGGYREGYGEGYGEYGHGREWYIRENPDRDRHRSERMRNHADKIFEGMEMYDYGRDRYQHGDNDERMVEGLEKLMYGVCMLVESTMDFAESPQEKEIIRKHLRKIKEI